MTRGLGAAWVLSTALILVGSACSAGADRDSAAFAIIDPDGPGSWRADGATNANDLAWGDATGDGRLDLAIAHESGSAARGDQVYRALPGGGLELLWESPFVDVVSHGVAWGDFDGDGRLDLAIATEEAPNQIWWNTGAVPAFELVWESAVEESRTRDVAWADVNRDGFLDVAFAGFNHPSELYLSPGELLPIRDPAPALPPAPFGQVPDWVAPTDVDARALAFGDADGDGWPELAEGASRGPARVFPNVFGTLGDVPSWTSPHGGVSHDVEWADFDADGDLDLLVLNGGTDEQRALCAESSDDDCPPIDRVWVNSGGQITQEAFADFTGEGQSRAAAVADLDGDGLLDFVVGEDDYVSNGTDIGQTWLHRNGGGTEPSDWVLGPGEQLFGEVDYDKKGLAFGDLDGDGLLELGLVSDGTEATHVFDGVGVGLAAAGEVNTVGPIERDVSLGDWDDDGALDLAVAASEYGVHIYAGVPDGPLAAPLWSWADPPSDLHVVAVAFADLDGIPGSRLDVAFASSSGGSGVVFEPGTADEWIWRAGDEGSNMVAVGDIDGDGRVDLVFGGNASDAGDQPDWAVVNAGGEEPFAWEARAEAPRDTDDGRGWTVDVDLADVDGDGDLDLAAAVVEQGFAVYRWDRDNAGWSSPTWSARGVAARAVAWGDVDGDGAPDLAVGRGDAPPIGLVRSQDGVLLTSPEWLPSPETGEAACVSWGDIDGDGDLDLAASLRDGGGQLLANRAAQGRGELVPEGTLPPEDIGGMARLGMAWGDLDGDGDLDFARAQGNSGVGLHRNQRQGSAGGLASTEGRVRIAVPLRRVAEVGAIGTGWDLEAAPEIPLTLTITDPESDPTGRVLLDFSPAPGVPFRAATIAGAPLEGLAGSPEGSDHTVTWSALADGATGSNVRLRARIVTHHHRLITHPIQRGATWAITEPFAVAGCGAETDGDGDGFACGLDDCNDSDAEVHPGAAEVCNGRDDDCDGAVPSEEEDGDGDGWSACSGDCDDLAPAIHPTAPEACESDDRNCDGREGFVDGDGDGASGCDDDCDDARADVFPDAVEQCADGVDHDCDGTETADRDDPECWAETDCGGCSASPQAPGLLALPIVFALRRRRSGAAG
jgi:hypothetical protein